MGGLTVEQELWTWWLGEVVEDERRLKRKETDGK